MREVTARAPDGREMIVTEKVFNLTLRDEGWTMVGETETKTPFVEGPHDANDPDSPPFITHKDVGTATASSADDDLFADELTPAEEVEKDFEALRTESKKPKVPVAKRKGKNDPQA